MRLPNVRFAFLLASIGLFAFGGNLAAQAAHAHMGHVADGWRDTPDQVGLLPAAVVEAEIAARHAGLAAGSGSLGAIKAHIGHVLHALDPTVEESGPGKGYGVVKAATGAARHIGLAANSGDASANVKTHANHVETSVNNVVEWARRVIELCGEVKASEDQAAATELAKEIQAMTQAMVSGQYADGNGRTSWSEGEGGLEQLPSTWG